ncbi:MULTISPECIES: gliding motility lipoprotein GldD [unclassified Arcicella]|uniref:gliding motility lipoprotein GldD n=1 Tax=unclassified Arcicella TaxID=2644986 RepID=UPI00285B4543|nr:MULTISPECIES: gliding motility lipoprotein GldD [unclassified Arcicella]MDR6560914.1 gliding motility-associated lipoprotein GldD [Arcicella sp. BE51]MDR6822148.1 gliding motility-associated lipoprotein GldD [Arcicella sp. BE139]
MMIKKRFLFYSSASLLACTFLILSLSSCRKKQDNNDYVPKPKGFNRIDLPPTKYVQLLENHPYTFQYSSQAIIKPDTVAWAEPHWIYIYYPNYKAVIQLTYKNLNNDPNKLSKLIDDAYKLAAKHNQKASSIQNYVLTTGAKQKAMLIQLEGEVPTYLQFYTTDSTKHYLRGALYFNTALKSDSLEPVIEYLKKDVIRLVNTLQWKK